MRVGSESTATVTVRVEVPDVHKQSPVARCTQAFRRYAPGTLLNPCRLRKTKNHTPCVVENVNPWGRKRRTRILYYTGEGTLFSEEELPADFLGVFRTRHRVPLGARICRQRRKREEEEEVEEGVNVQVGRAGGGGGQRAKIVSCHKRHG